MLFTKGRKIEKSMVDNYVKCRININSMEMKQGDITFTNVSTTSMQFAAVRSQEQKIGKYCIVDEDGSH